MISSPEIKLIKYAHFYILISYILNSADQRVPIGLITVITKIGVSVVLREFTFYSSTVVKGKAVLFYGFH